MNPVNTNVNHNQTLTNNIEHIITPLDDNEIQTLYRVYNYLLQITEHPIGNVHLSENEIKLLHKMFLETKINIVKAIHVSQNKMNAFLSQKHIKTEP